MSSSRNSSHLLKWPTDYPEMFTQRFGDRPEFYKRYNLPGHEGVDLVAPAGSPIYACAGGEVKLVSNTPTSHPYGIHVRVVSVVDLEGRERFVELIYAHLSQALVRTGDWVPACAIIGRAGSTGNSSGPHLHLTMKIKEATARGETLFPRDIVNPEPYLSFERC